MPRAQSTLHLQKLDPRFSDEAVAELTSALATAAPYLPAATYASNQAKYGTEHDWMIETLKYWQNTFDWRKAEARYAEVDHYTAVIEDDGAPRTVHFIAHFSDDEDAIPLLFLHGWPGSFFEFIDVIKILRKSTSPSFHLVCPAQPGFPGWSDPPPLDKGYGMYDVARLMNSLMVGLGFEGGYAAQGGDIGSVIGRIMAVRYPSCKALNVNYLPLLPPSTEGSPDFDGLTELEVTNAKKAYTFASTGRGYGVMHGTRPGTIGMIVGSSPVNLLAWLGEKFRDWTDETPSIDAILETVSLWWMSKAFPTSLYAYPELTGGVGPWHRDPALYVNKPMGFSSFAYEIASAPKVWAAQTGNLQFYAYHESGGHFAAFEQPELFAEDMRKCFGKIYPRDA